MMQAQLFPPAPAPYRSRPDLSRGRLVTEPQSAFRTAFQRDRDRIVHSSAFRRLALKTQVFLPEEGDHYRTRLTHTIEVAQITRTLTRALGLDDDLGEALALAHDLGHTPFGHTGEDALAAVMAPFGGFDHNAQTVRVVTLLERRYPAFVGLNLSWETLDGLVGRGRPGSHGAWARLGLPTFENDGWRDSLGSAPFASGEAQAAALADDIAYNAHDVEDGLQAGFFELAALEAVPLLAATRDRLAASAHDADLIVRGLARELVGCFVEGAITESRKRLAAVLPKDADAVRHAKDALVALPPELLAASEAIKAFLFRHMYRHRRLLATRERAGAAVRELAHGMLEDPDLLPPKWRAGGLTWTREWHARRVTEHRRLFDASSDLR